MSKICSKCAQELSDDAKWCTMCGTPCNDPINHMTTYATNQQPSGQPPTSQYNPTTQSYPVQSQQFIEHSSAVPTTSAPTHHSNKSAQKKRSKRAIIVVVTIIVVLLAGTGIALLLYNMSTSGLSKISNTAYLTNAEPGLASNVNLAIVDFVLPESANISQGSSGAVVSAYTSLDSRR